MITEQVSFTQACRKDTADYLFLRYLADSQPGAALALWVEFKMPSCRFRKGQQEWHERERLRGGLVWGGGFVEDFEVAYERELGALHDFQTSTAEADPAGVRSFNARKRQLRGMR